MRKNEKRFFTRSFGLTLLILLLLLGQIHYQTAWAAFDNNVEKIKPEFTRTENKIIAKLIPRAKSTSVFIDFEVTNGRLAEVAAMDFKEAARPGMDHKDFKSALFVVRIEDIPRATEVKLSITSDFFTSSTEFWIFNEKSETAWMNSNAENIGHPNQVQELVMKVKDGGKFDSDGLADGRITIVGGPKDSFWGYALGTLFIRFFGIFLVLSILMIGMILAGKIFLYVEKKTKKEGKILWRTTEAASEGIKPTKAEKEMGPEQASAISLALHLHLATLQSPEPMHLLVPRISSWTQQGREQIMGERFLVFNRSNR